MKNRNSNTTRSNLQINPDKNKLKFTQNSFNYEIVNKNLDMMVSESMDYSPNKLLNQKPTQFNRTSQNFTRENPQSFTSHRNKSREKRLDRNILKSSSNVNIHNYFKNTSYQFEQNDFLSTLKKSGGKEPHTSTNIYRKTLNSFDFSNTKTNWINETDKIKKSLAEFKKKLDMNSSKRISKHALALTSEQLDEQNMNFNKNLGRVNKLTKIYNNLETEQENAIRILKLIFHCENEEVILKNISSNKYSSILISTNLNVRDLVIKTICFKFKSYIRFLTEEGLKSLIDSEDRYIELEFQKAEDGFQQEIINITKEVKDVQAAVEVEQEEVEHQISNLVWDFRLKNEYLALMRMNYSGRQGEMPLMQQKMQEIELLQENITYEMKIIDKNVIEIKSKKLEPIKQILDPNEDIATKDLTKTKEELTKLLRKVSNLKEEAVNKKIQMQTELEDCQKKNLEYINYCSDQKHLTDLISKLKNEQEKQQSQRNSFERERKRVERENIEKLKTQEERRGKLMNENLSQANLGVQTTFDMDVFRRQMKKANEVRKLKDKRGEKKLEVSSKINMSDTLMMNFVVNQQDWKEISGLFLDTDEVMAEKELYVKLMSQPLKIKDNAFLFDIKNYITKGALARSEKVLKVNSRDDWVSDEDDWGQSADEPAEEVVNFQHKNVVIKRLQKLLEQSSIELELDQFLEGKFNANLQQFVRRVKPKLLAQERDQRGKLVVSIEWLIGECIRIDNHESSMFSMGLKNQLHVLIFKFNREVKLMTSRQALDTVELDEFLKYQLSSDFCGINNVKHEFVEEEPKDRTSLFFDDRDRNRDIKSKKFQEQENNQRPKFKYIENKHDFSISISEDDISIKDN